MKRTFTHAIFVLLLMSSSLMVIQFKGKTLFTILQFLWILVFLLKYRNVYVDIENKWFYGIIISAFPTMLTAVISNVRESYVKAAVYMGTMHIVLCCVAVSLYTYIKDNREELFAFVKVLKFVCILQLFWTYAQYFLYSMYEIDLNDLVFVKTFHLMEKASSYKNSWQFCPSGFCWHPILMAIIIVLTYLLFDNIIVKVLAISIAPLLYNSTAVIGISICIALDLFFGIRKVRKERLISVKVLAVIFLMIVGIVCVLKFTNVSKFLLEKIQEVWQRITGDNTDYSTMAHKNYYLSYFRTYSISNIGQVLFGYGEGCSGWAMTVLYDQYSDLNSWVVESDIMNTLLSRGIVGFICRYAWLVLIAIKGLKINYKYFILIVTIILEGITYNVQFDWVFLVEVLIMIAVEMNIDIFDINNNCQV